MLSPTVGHDCAIRSGHVFEYSGAKIHKIEDDFPDSFSLLFGHFRWNSLLFGRVPSEFTTTSLGVLRIHYYLTHSALAKAVTFDSARQERAVPQTCANPYKSVQIRCR